MTAKDLREILERVEAWPEEAQEEALSFLLALERELADPYVLTEEDRAAIERGLDDMRHGRFASDEEVSAVFRRRG
jgi:predicted transcriptional regulator